MKVGIEIESCSRDYIERDSTSGSKERARIEDYILSLGWEVKGDGSIDGPNGVEVASPILNMEIGKPNPHIECVCESLEKRWIPHHTCGVHIHVDCSRMGWMQTRNAYAMMLRGYDFALMSVSDSDEHPGRFSLSKSMCRPIRCYSRRPISLSRVGGPESLAVEFYRSMGVTLRSDYTIGDNYSKYQAFQYGVVLHGKADNRVPAFRLYA